MYCLAPEKMVEKWFYREIGRDISEKNIYIIVSHEWLDDKYNHKMTTIYFVTSCTSNATIKSHSTSHLTLHMTPISTTAEMRFKIDVLIGYQFQLFECTEEHINFMISAI